MMTVPSADSALPLDEVMLAMDVVDTLRHRQDLAARELNGEAREAGLIEKLREIYRQQGIEVPDHILKEGVSALSESRFVYTPPKGGLGTMLARFYVSRKVWGRAVAALFLASVIGLGSYQFGYAPWRSGQAETARIELSVGVPAELDALYVSIYDETKIHSAVAKAAEIRDRGKVAASESNRPSAEAALVALRDLRNEIRREYTIRVVNRDGVESGFWAFPEVNTEATNYYIVVEALDRNGKALSLPILNEEDGTRETVNLWGLRVTESVYNSVAADKRDDGIIQRNIVGRKQYGFIDIDYSVSVLGGAVTRW